MENIANQKTIEHPKKVEFEDLMDTLKKQKQMVCLHSMG